jgi:hypothetical protein
MRPAEEEDVVYVARAAVRPVPQMVAVGPAGRTVAARKPAVAVAFLDRSPLRGR